MTFGGYLSKNKLQKYAKCSYKNKHTKTSLKCVNTLCNNRYSLTVSSKYNVQIQLPWGHSGSQQSAKLQNWSDIIRLTAPCQCCVEEKEQLKSSIEASVLISSHSNNQALAKAFIQTTLYSCIFFLRSVQFLPFWSLWKQKGKTVSLCHNHQQGNTQTELRKD